ncbi:MAG: HmuY family protein [Saprospiraceae bacterium]|nr:HmuY family protein [Saprospiraceae bacterium]
MKINYYLFLLSILFSFYSCSDDPVTINGVRSVKIVNLPADPATSYDPTNGTPIGTKNLFTFFRFSDSTIVPNTDSATAKWDIAFKASTILINSGTSGPGLGAAFVETGLFSDIKEVPVSGIFKTDSTLANLAIGKSWYTYDAAAMVFNPTPGKIFVIKTADNKFVKMEILSYYKDSPIAPNSRADAPRYYTFRYVYQPSGSTKFE